MTPAQIEFRVRMARALEFDALEELRKGQIGAVEGAIDRALAWLRPASAAGQATPGLGSVGGRLKAALSADEAVLQLVPSRANRGLAISKLDTAILRKDQALETLIPRTTPPQPPADPAPPPAPPPPPQKAPDGLLAGLAQVDRDIGAAIGRMGKPKNVYDVGGDRPLFSAYWRLHNLARQYLPLDEALLDARESLGWAGDWAAGARYGSVAGARESLRAAGADFKAAEADFTEAAGGVAAYPALNAAATSLAGTARSLAEQADTLAERTSGRLPAGRDLTRVQEGADALRNGQEQFETLLAAEYGLPRLFVLRSLGQAVGFLYEAGSARSSLERVDLLAARAGKKRLEALLAAVHTVTITAEDGWTHNPALGRSRDCVDVTTDPPQAFISAEVGGPNGSASLGRTPIPSGGKIQLRVVIDPPGVYTWTIAVYDAQGTQSGTVTVTSDVAPPPQNKAIDPPCDAPQ